MKIAGKTRPFISGAKYLGDYIIESATRVKRDDCECIILAYSGTMVRYWRGFPAPGVGSHSQVFVHVPDGWILLAGTDGKSQDLHQRQHMGIVCEYFARYFSEPPLAGRPH